MPIFTFSRKFNRPHWHSAAAIRKPQRAKIRPFDISLLAFNSALDGLFFVYFSLTPFTWLRSVSLLTEFRFICIQSNWRLFLFHIQLMRCWSCVSAVRSFFIPHFLLVRACACRIGGDVHRNWFKRSRKTNRNKKEKKKPCPSSEPTHNGTSSEWHTSTHKYSLIFDVEYIFPRESWDKRKWDWIDFWQSFFFMFRFRDMPRIWMQMFRTHLREMVALVSEIAV